VPRTHATPAALLFLSPVNRMASAAVGSRKMKTVSGMYGSSRISEMASTHIPAARPSRVSLRKTCPASPDQYETSSRYMNVAYATTTKNTVQLLAPNSSRWSMIDSPVPNMSEKRHMIDMATPTMTRVEMTIFMTLTLGAKSSELELLPLLGLSPPSLSPPALATCSICSLATSLSSMDSCAVGTLMGPLIYILCGARLGRASR